MTGYFFEAPIKGDAQFSRDKKFRHVLTRSWSAGSYLPLICMANPIKAGAAQDDPTIQTLIRYFRALPKCDGFHVVNWSPKVATHPVDHDAWLKGLSDGEWNRIMGANLYLLSTMTRLAPYVVVAWGNLLPVDSVRCTAYTKMVVGALSLSGKKDLWCFGVNANGSPKHPMARGKHRIDPAKSLVRWHGEEGDKS